MWYYLTIIRLIDSICYSSHRFEPEIALVYRGTDGRIATNRVQSPPKLGHDKYDTSYEAYQVCLGVCMYDCGVLLAIGQ